MVIERIRAFLLVCLACLGLMSHAFAAVTAQVDRARIGADESFTLIIDTPTGAAEPDLAPLDADFDVLGTTQSSQIQIINGRTSSSRKWLIKLAPKREGKLTIPSLALGKEATQPIEILVSKPNAKSAAQKDVFLEADVDVGEPYVQQQVILTVRLLHRVPLREGALSKPQIKDAVVDRLGDDTAYETQRGAERYRVIERRYAIFPQKSGDIAVEGLHFDGKVPDPRAQERSGGLFGRGLFDDPFDLLQPTTTVRVRAPSIALKVKTIPPNAQRSPWLPARSVSLSESWSENPPKFAVGQPITRTLTLQAQGLGVAQLPPLDPPQLKFANLYPDHSGKQARADSGGVVSEAEQKLAIIPTQAGEFELPEIRIPWWNVEKNRQEFAVVPSRKITVAAAPAGTAAPAPQTDAEPAEHGMEMEPVDFSAKPAATDVDPTWRWIGIAALVAWLLTLALWIVDRRRRSASQQRQSGGDAASHNRGAGKDALKKAYAANDPIAARAALLSWARQHWPERQFNNLGDVAAMSSDTAAKRAIAMLDRALYADKPAAWNQADFLARVEAIFAKKRGGGPAELALPPLYPPESSAA